MYGVVTLEKSQADRQIHSKALAVIWETDDLVRAVFPWSFTHSRFAVREHPEQYQYCMARSEGLSEWLDQNIKEDAVECEIGRGAVLRFHSKREEGIFILRWYEEIERVK